MFVFAPAAIAAILTMPAPAVLGPQSPAPAPQTITLAAQMIRSFHNMQTNLTQAAEKMPEADYDFKPTPEIRPFGQLIAHTAFAQFGTCGAMKGDAHPPHSSPDEKEDTPRSKAQLVALMKESSDYCGPAVDAMTDAAMTTLIKIGNNQGAKGLLLGGLMSHGNEMYGTMCVYLRLKGIVPPSTERANAAKK